MKLAIDVPIMYVRAEIVALNVRLYVRSAVKLVKNVLTSVVAVACVIIA